MASHSPSAKLTQPCHLAADASFTVTSSSLGYDWTQQVWTQQVTSRSEVKRRWLAETRVAMQRHIELIGAAWGLGGADPGCAEAPAALAPLLAQRLEACGVPSVPAPMLRAMPAQ